MGAESNVIQYKNVTYAIQHLIRVTAAGQGLLFRVQFMAVENYVYFISHINKQFHIIQINIFT